MQCTTRAPLSRLSSTKTAKCRLEAYRKRVRCTYQTQNPHSLKSKYIRGQTICNTADTAGKSLLTVSVLFSPEIVVAQWNCHVEKRSKHAGSTGKPLPTVDLYGVLRLNRPCHGIYTTH